MTILTARVEAEWGGNNRIVSPPSTLSRSLSLFLSLAAHSDPGWRWPFPGASHEAGGAAKLSDPASKRRAAFSSGSISASPVVDPTLVFLSLGLQPPQEDEEEARRRPGQSWSESESWSFVHFSGEEEPLHRLDFLLLLVVLSFWSSALKSLSWSERISVVREELLERSDQV